MENAPSGQKAEQLTKGMGMHGKLIRIGLLIQRMGKGKVRVFKGTQLHDLSPGQVYYNLTRNAMWNAKKSTFITFPTYI